jgi:hypothetical protein
LKGRSYIANGAAILFAKDAQYMNGFGAMMHVMVKCTYDLKADVASVEIIPAR